MGFEGRHGRRIERHSHGIMRGGIHSESRKNSVSINPPVYYNGPEPKWGDKLTTFDHYFMPAMLVTTVLTINISPGLGITEGFVGLVYLGVRTYDYFHMP